MFPCDRATDVLPTFKPEELCMTAIGLARMRAPEGLMLAMASRSAQGPGGGGGLQFDWTCRCNFAACCPLGGASTGIFVPHSCDRTVPMVL